MNFYLIVFHALLISSQFLRNFCQGFRCYTDSCDPDDSARFSHDVACSGALCFLDITGPTPNYTKINRGCLDREFLLGEGDGCFLINLETKRYFCQCRSDFCNGPFNVDTSKTVGNGRNVSCDTGCRLIRTHHPRRGRIRGSRPRKVPGLPGRHQLVCGRTTAGPFCSYDPQSR